MDCENYFESYDDLKIHELMLKDDFRNKAYKDAIFDNRSKFQGKTVLDVGAGTAILSVFCAQAGAAKVYAVEASGIYKVAQEIIKENGFEEKIQIINSRVEDVNLPEKVDIIVSEWMGFYLLHEGMLDSVIFARDKFLKNGGLLFPESATIYSSPCSVPDMFENWNDVEGISMQCFSKKLREETATKPRTAVVAADNLLAESEVVTWFDLREVTLEEVETIKLSHVAVANKNGRYQGICLWFTCTFPSFSSEPVTLSTAPEDPETHWKQTTIVLPTEVEVEKGAPIAYELSLTKSKEDMRRYNIDLVMLDSEEVEHPEYCGCYMTKCILAKAVLENYERSSLPQ